MLSTLSSGGNSGTGAARPRKLCQCRAHQRLCRMRISTRPR